MHSIAYWLRFRIPTLARSFCDNQKVREEMSTMKTTMTMMTQYHISTKDLPLAKAFDASSSISLQENTESEIDELRI